MRQKIVFVLGVFLIGLLSIGISEVSGLFPLWVQSTVDYPDPVEFGELLTINATVTSDYSIENVWLVRGSNPVIKTRMDNVDGDTYQTTNISTSRSQIGTHYYQIEANDSSGTHITAGSPSWTYTVIPKQFPI